MKKTLTTLAAIALMSVGGVASAAEPLQLTDNQMDIVSAGQSSAAITAGFALIGTVASGSETKAVTKYSWHGVTKVTSASAATISTGAVVVAGAAAASHN